MPAPSLNALRHGLRSRHLVLPGERPEEYEAFVAGYFEALRPRTAAAAAAAAQIGDLAWRVERLTHIEAGRERTRLEDALRTSDLARRIRALDDAQTAARAIASAVRDVPEPAASAAPLMISGVGGAVDVIDELGASAVTHVEILRRCLREAFPSEAMPQIEAYGRLGQAAEHVSETLAAERRVLADQLEDARQVIARSTPLLDAEDLRRLGRHRQLLESAMQRQLAIFSTLQELSTKAEKAEHMVQLRVVR